MLATCYFACDAYLGKLWAGSSAEQCLPCADCQEQRKRGLGASREGCCSSAIKWRPSIQVRTPMALLLSACNSTTFYGIPLSHDVFWHETSPSSAVTVMVAAAEVCRMARALWVACLQAPRQCVRIPEAPRGALGPPAQHPTEGSQLPKGQHSRYKWFCRCCTVYTLQQTFNSGEFLSRPAPLAWQSLLDILLRQTT